MNLTLYFITIKRLITTGLLLLLLLPAIVQAGDYMLVVNSTNTYSSRDVTETKILIKHLYTKLKSEWPTADKPRARMIDRAINSSTHAKFVHNVLGMSGSELEGYWARLKQKTGETPPRAVKSARVALKLVARNKGAFTIIERREGRFLNKGVKILFEF